MRVCVSHLLGSITLQLGAAESRTREHAGSDADGQVEGIHLVIMGMEVDTVQHCQHVTQQQRIITGQTAHQPVRMGRGQRAGVRGCYL